MFVVACAVLAGCSEGQIESTSGDVRIWLHESGFATGGSDAIVAGTVVFDRANNCILLEEGSSRLPVIWPSDARIMEQNPVTIRVQGETVSEGDVVEGAGGYQQVGRFDDLIPAECHGSGGGVAMFNSDSSIEVRSP